MQSYIDMHKAYTSNNSYKMYIEEEMSKHTHKFMALFIKTNSSFKRANSLIKFKHRLTVYAPINYIESGLPLPLGIEFISTFLIDANKNVRLIKIEIMCCTLSINDGKTLTFLTSSN